MTSSHRDIFVVDDEEKVLAGIRRSLAGYASSWNLFYFASPLEALDRFRAAPADVVVTDMMMPDMTGLEMVMRMRGTAPNSVFIMLTGSADLRTAADAVNQAAVHKFLMKPCPSTVLIEGIESAVQERQIAESAQQSGRLSKAALNMLSTGVIIVDRDGRVQLINDAAANLVAAKDGLYVNSADNICRATRTTDSQALLDIIRGTLESVDTGDEPGVISLPRDSLGRPLTIAAMPAEQATDGLPAGRFVCLYVCDPDAEVLPSANVIGKLFELTPAEARVAQAIASGEDLNAIADSQGVTVSTARTYLKRVFNKTGTGRQAELVKLLHTSPALYPTRNSLERNHIG